MTFINKNESPTPDQESNLKQKAIVVISGGLDSTTALYWAMREFEVIGAVSFNYGQKHAIELTYAEKTCQKLNIKHYIQDINIFDSHSCLTSDKKVPSGHYADDNMKVTVVNNRNSIMFSLATSLAIDLQADKIVVGIHAGDHFIYPDCRTAFIQRFNQLMKLANEGFVSEQFSVIAPFVMMSKADIAELGILLGLDESSTYSDYEGGKIQNSQSGTSVERIEAISEAYYRIGKLIEPIENYNSFDKTKYINKSYAVDLLVKRKKEERLQTILTVIKTNTDNLFNLVADERSYNYITQPVTISYDYTTPPVTIS